MQRLPASPPDEHSVSSSHTTSPPQDSISLALGSHISDPLKYAQYEWSRSQVTPPHFGGGQQAFTDRSFTLHSRPGAQRL